MKKQLLTALFVVTFFACASVSASAVENDLVKVGLRYGSSALFSANLENAQGIPSDILTRTGTLSRCWRRTRPPFP